MSARILIVEDEEPLTLLLRYNLEAEGYDVDTVARGDEADTQLRGEGARSRRARLDAAGPVRHRAVPPAARAAGDQGAADHHADRARRGKRARPRTCDRRRRLHRQAVLGARADRAGARAAAPRFARAGRRRADLRRHRARPREEARLARRPRGRSRPDRIPAARIPDGAARAACSRASSCSTASGARRSISTSAPSTCMSAGCARRSTAAASRIPIRTVRGAGYALDDRFDRSRQLETSAVRNGGGRRSLRRSVAG